MDIITYDRLLLKTAFCCMASDGHIDEKEIDIIRTMCANSPHFENFDFNDEINKLVSRINTDSQEFIKNYFGLLIKSELNEEEELTLIDFAIKTINADDKIEYSEIKFFKNIRHRLKASDDKILKAFPDIEMYLEDDIITDTYLDKITSQYLDSANLPQFELIKIMPN